MKRPLALVFMVFFITLGGGGAAICGEGETPPGIIISGEDVDLSQFQWTSRPLIVFADSPRDPRYIKQMENITARLEDLAVRDVVVLTDTTPDAHSALRERLHPHGFMLVLIGKDGVIYLRKPVPWSVREINRSIDKLPLRQEEIRERNTGAS